MTRLRSVLALSAVVLLAGLARAEDALEWTKKLEGTYVIVSGERDGKRIPEERIKGSVVTFKGDKVYGADKDKKEFFASTYKLDTMADPVRITMVSTTPPSSAGQSTVGLIGTDGTRLKIIYALPGGAAPTGFKTGEQQNLFILKRAD